MLSEDNPGADAGGLGSMTGEAVVRLARDPSPPILTPKIPGYTSA